MSTATAIVELWNAPQGRSARIHELADVRRANISVSEIVPNPHQPRKEINVESADFIELADNIRAQGLLQPILVAQESGESYVLIAGERRWRAMVQLAKEHPRFATIAATVLRLREDKPEAQILVKAISENLARTNLEPVEMATAIAKLRDLTSWTLEEIAQQMGLSLTRVGDLAAVSASKPVMAALSNGSISTQQGVVIARRASDDGEAREMVSRVQGKSLSETKRALSKPSPREHPTVRTPPPQVNVDRLPIARLVGGGLTPREEIYASIQRTCDVLGWWPQPR